jgi:hypothetical protein
MDTLKFAFKLLKHGGIFVLRVIGILAPTVVSAFAAGDPSGSATKKMQDPLQIDLGHFSDGTPYYTNSSDAQWETHYGDRK